MASYLQGGTTKNIIVAVQKQNTYYVKAGIQGNNFGYNKIPNELLAQTVTAGEVNTRNIKFEIPSPIGMTPGPYGLAGSQTIGALISPPNVTDITTAGV